jgi:hypothetical protein
MPETTFMYNYFLDKDFKVLIKTKKMKKMSLPKSVCLEFCRWNDTKVCNGVRMYDDYNKLLINYKT